ncbi:TorD/DmsD family molecular chaperone [Halosimplex pelagicum]|uniref:Molecular chaperone TorD family protein n=1 Tax=Halosimplex pelagicum TaxID=869886 RepID=A0A7D5PD36_9EURY|nr:molecular chaperone TorD family protein [Halosimplex pelagicum]QLH82958.1 molecular chaperone TorD family protein [Halosimplex pelagicum]
MTRLDEADPESARSGIDSEAAVDGPSTEDRAARERLHAARATLYAAAGGAFCYPDVETRATLTAHDAREGVLEAAERLGLRESAERFLDAVADAAVSDLEAAYNDLFGLPDGGEYPVVPYEAHYTTGSDVGESQRRIAAVVGLMETFGVEPGEEFAERQDHVAAELELMQVVAAQRATALHRGDDEAVARLADAERTVVDTHLAGFVPALAHDVEAAADDDPSDGRRAYRAAARLAAELVERDHAARGGGGDGDESDDADTAGEGVGADGE